MANQLFDLFAVAFDSHVGEYLFRESDMGELLTGYETGMRPGMKAKAAN